MKASKGRTLLTFSSRDLKPQVDFKVPFALQGQYSLFIILRAPEVKFMPLQESDPEPILSVIPT